MNKKIKAATAIAAVFMAGCSTAPKEVKVPFTYESKILEINIESKVNDGDVVELFKGNVQFVPNYSITPYKYQNIDITNLAIPYRFKEGVVDSASCEQPVGECHFFNVQAKDGVEFQVAFVGSDKVHFAFQQHEILNETVFDGLSLPHTFTNMASGITSLKESGVIHDGKVIINRDGDKVVYETVIKYRTIEE